MFSGAHVLFFSRDAEADRAFLRESLGMPFVDAGHGWLIFQLPPAETAVHPADTTGTAPKNGSLLPAEVYLMCDDLEATMGELRARGVELAPVQEERWGRLTRLMLPSGGALGLYQPKHATAFDL
ncbi:VOC family protein [Paludibaculum fermentans]|uniref:Extradiol dioxygenase n=1 Tax=Paludibaculum fermentans TaxID=1473598 RepID=A0A7S7NLT2_PALFE|nr:VOC family protein [Paludibaculum fermentans]QOY85955.1 extradiol dioxygenase [Paludibaculum fermentans]